MFDLVSHNAMLQMADRGMTLASRRMTLIASNLANIDTPGYRTQDFNFEDAFKAEMEKLDRQLSPGSLGSAGSSFSSGSGVAAPTITDPLDITSERNDLNDVHLDRETMNLAKSQEIYQLSSNFAQNELRTVLGAIRDAAR
jgi:flagellar basal-body rod protein FlgB